MPYNGIFTKKARRQAAHHNLVETAEDASTVGSRVGRRERVPTSFCNTRRPISRGRDAARV